MGLPWDWLTVSTSEVTASCRNALRKRSDSWPPEPAGSSEAA
jgi:hypothetical protein